MLLIIDAVVVRPLDVHSIVVCSFGKEQTRLHGREKVITQRVLPVSINVVAVEEIAVVGSPAN